MNPEELNQKLQKLIDSAEDSLLNAIRSHQNAIFKEVVRLLSRRQRGLILDSNGRIHITGANGRENRKRLAAIKADAANLVLNNFIRGKVREYTETFAKIEKEYSEFYKDASGYVREGIVALVRDAEKRVRDLFLNGLDTELGNPIDTILSRALQGISLDALEDELEVIKTETTTENRVIVAKRRGLFERYINNQLLSNRTADATKVQDSLHGFSGSVANAAQAQAGLGWIYYGGPKDTKKRLFCAERVRGYYTIEEVHSWVQEDWQGKNPDMTEENALILRGGYNCRDKWIPVPAAIVPAKWIDRAIRLGFIEQ